MSSPIRSSNIRSSNIPSSIRSRPISSSIRSSTRRALTFGIYGIVVLSNVSTSINTAASRYDGKHTMHFCLVTFLFSWLTFGILPLVWFSKISTRIGNELTRRGINYSFSAKHFWLWGFLGSIIIAGPFIYYHRLLTAMNLICEDYNRVG